MAIEIRCPKCNWQPDGNDYWDCKACGYEWDMFETAGRCPRCDFQHEDTPCVEWAGGCSEISPHLDWYGGLDEGLEEIAVYRENQGSR